MNYSSAASGVNSKISFGVQPKALQSVLRVSKLISFHLPFQQFAAFDGEKPVIFCS